MYCFSWFFWYFDEKIWLKSEATPKRMPPSCSSWKIKWNPYVTRPPTVCITQMRAKNTPKKVSVGPKSAPPNSNRVANWKIDWESKFLSRSPLGDTLEYKAKYSLGLRHFPKSWWWSKSFLYFLYFLFWGILTKQKLSTFNHDVYLCC